MVPPKIQAWGKKKFDTNLTTLRQSPLNPSMIWIVDAMRRAPCVPLIVRTNFFMWAIKSLSVILEETCVKRDWNLVMTDEQLSRRWWVPREGLLHCCTVQPRWSRWWVRRRCMSHPSQQEDVSRRMFGTGCLCQLRTISSEPPELSLPDRFSIWALIQCKL